MRKNKIDLELQTRVLGDAPESGFNLKHRITGAAVLLFFGVLFLPWVLGPPSNSQETVKLNNAMADNTAIELIKVKESKDAMLNIHNSEKQAVVKIDDKFEINKKRKQQQNSLKVLSAEDKVFVSIIGGDRKTISKLKPVPTKQILKKTESKAVKTKSVKPKSVKPSSEPKVLAKKTAITKGWIISVGVYSKQENTSAMMKKLSKQHFKPKQVTIDTRNGKATRVWLGPFKNKTDANSAKQKLKARMSIAGLVKAYP